jgi:DNA-binding MarR family transcriptional regulator
MSSEEEKRKPRPKPSVDEVAAVLRASRAFAGLSAASIAAVDDMVTVAQLRVLVMVATRPTLNLAAVAAELDVNPSNASRTCDRLVAAGLLDRRESAADRRNIELALTPAGRQLVDAVINHRRTAIRRVLRKMEPADRGVLAATLDKFATAAGEPVYDDLSTLI